MNNGLIRVWDETYKEQYIEQDDVYEIEDGTYGLFDVQNFEIPFFTHKVETFNGNTYYF